MTTPPPTFELHSSFAADVLIVECVGEVDMSTAPRLCEAVEATADSTRRVVVDLSEVTFLDSSALNALVHAQRTLETREIVLRIVSPAEQPVRRIFEITHLTESLNVVESLDSALA
ncbi:MAG TPA: STAS domain-containing protein [Gaiellaceae bacterium]|jgi:anti-anti-sigma factor|nr:STAS domain-containing protein [Gaiellaceae bacterium]